MILFRHQCPWFVFGLVSCRCYYCSNLLYSGERVVGFRKKGIAIALVSVLALALVGSVLYAISSRNNSVMSENVAMRNLEEDLPPGYVAADLRERVSPDFAYPVSEEAKEAVGEQQAQAAGRWAIAFTYATFYDNWLWEDLVTREKLNKDLTAEDFSAWEQYMNDNGKKKWQELLASGSYPAENIQDFIILPDQSENIKWYFPEMRPSTLQKDDGTFYEADNWDLSTVGVSNTYSKEDGTPYLVVDLVESHIFDFVENGNWKAEKVTRPIRLVLEPTNSKQQPFLLADWAIGDVTPTEVEEVVKRLK